MIIKCFSMYDAKAKAYLTPFFMPNHHLAIRAISTCLKDPNHQFTNNPEDFTLFEIESWDDTSGCFSTKGNPEPVATCLQMRPLPPKPLPLEEAIQNANNDETSIQPSTSSGNSPL